MNYTLYHGDCLVEMDKIPDKSVHLVVSDFPYANSGQTECGWDSLIDLESLWKQYDRVLVENGTLVLFAGQPFTTRLISSNYPMFKYTLVWEKTKAMGFLQAKNMPLRSHEDICIFSKGGVSHAGTPNRMTYNPQMDYGKPYYKKQKTDPRGSVWGGSGRTEYLGYSKSEDGRRYPKSVLKFSNPNNHSIHPTEKPVDLLEKLIVTYSNSDDTVLDNCFGSGSTGVACVNTNRNFIGIELYPLQGKPIDKKENPNYFFEAQARIEREFNKPRVIGLGV